MTSLRIFVQRRARRRQIGTWVMLIAVGVSLGAFVFALVVEAMGI